MSRLLLCTIIILGSLACSAQDINVGQVPFCELGLRFSGFDDFNLFYKKALDESSVRRYRIILGLASYNSNRKDVDINLGFAVGKEKRKMIAENLYFLHGIEFSLSLSHSNAEATVGDRNKQLFIMPRVGYVLGFQLDFSKKYCLSAELIPTIGGTIAMFNYSDDQLLLDAGVSSNATALSLMYRF